MPFASRETRDEAAQKLYNPKDLRAVEELLPFIGKPLLSKIAEEEFVRAGLCGLEAIARFST